MLQDPHSHEIGEQSFGVNRQDEFYIEGLAKIKPLVPVSFEELEAKAREKMRPEAFGYVSGNAGAGDATKANRKALERWHIVPRFLRDVSQRDLTTEVLGQKFSCPLMIAPVGIQGIIHKDGELATARAAKKLGVPMILSTFSSTPLEKVAEELGDTPKWFQLYWPNDPEICASLLKRAEAAGFGAIVVTLDSFHIGWREVDLQNAYNPFAHGDGLANYLSDPVFRSRLNLPEKLLDIAAIKKVIPLLTNPALTWEDLKFIREHTKLPFLLKGILRPDDARRALDAGASGVIVSNHGGRQVDAAVGALDALVAVEKAVGGKAAVLFDSGIRRGADICKALALGAQAVLVGRPYCYGLGIAGEKGVVDVLSNLLGDLDITLGLAGGAKLSDLRELVFSRDEIPG
jgi:lactate 2-monooxygenase